MLSFIAISEDRLRSRFSSLALVLGSEFDAPTLSDSHKRCPLQSASNGYSPFSDSVSKWIETQSLSQLVTDAFRKSALRPSVADGLCCCSRSARKRGTQIGGGLVRIWIKSLTYDFAAIIDVIRVKQKGRARQRQRVEVSHDAVPQERTDPVRPSHRKTDDLVLVVEAEGQTKRIV